MCRIVEFFTVFTVVTLIIVATLNPAFNIFVNDTICMVISVLIGLTLVSVVGLITSQMEEK